MSDSITPCPFCGSEAAISHDDYEYPRWVSCTKCECDGPPIPYKFSGSVMDARKYVVESWNRRVTVKQSPEPERLDEIIRESQWP